MRFSTGSIVDATALEQTKLRCHTLVIGTGAGGSVAGALIAEAGREVIFLEEGPFLDTSDYNSNLSDMTGKLYRDGGVFPFLGTPTMAFGEGCCVGGGTTINGALLWRTPPWVLDDWEQNHGLKGYTNKKLAAHFDQVERDLNVVQHTLEDDGNRDSLKIHNAAQSLGWKSVLVPRAIKDCINENLCPTGCMAGAKQGALQTYLPRAIEHGARIIYNCRADHIDHDRRSAKNVIAYAKGNRGVKISISFDELVISAGAVQTAHLLRRSGLSNRAGRELQFHLNLKIVALFNEQLHAQQGTIFTTQVQEFERQGILICASNLKPAYLAMTLSHFGDAVINRLTELYDRTAIYVAMTRPRSKAHIVSRFGSEPLVWYGFDPHDMNDIKLALSRTMELLFEVGAQELYLPVLGSEAIRTRDMIQPVLEVLSPKQLELITVHVMASCPMGSSSRSDVVDEDGHLWNGVENVTLADASVLPTNIGESPQGTIMAFAHEIVSRHLNE